MKTILNLAAVLSVLFSIGACSTQGQFLTNNEDAWINVKTDVFDGLYFCRANKKENGSANPICFEAAKAHRKD